MLQWSTTAIWECKYQEKSPYDTARKIIITHLHWRNEWNICTPPLPKLFQWSQSSAFRFKSALTLVLGEVRVWGEGRKLIFRYLLRACIVDISLWEVLVSTTSQLGGGGHGLREGFVPPPHPPHLLCSNDNLLCKNTFSLPNLPLLTESIMAVKQEVFNPFIPKIS